MHDRKVILSLHELKKYFMDLKRAVLSLNPPSSFSNIKQSNQIFHDPICFDSLESFAPLFPQLIEFEINNLPIYLIRETLGQSEFTNRITFLKFDNGPLLSLQSLLDSPSITTNRELDVTVLNLERGDSITLNFDDVNPNTHSFSKDEGSSTTTTNFTSNWRNLSKLHVTHTSLTSIDSSLSLVSSLYVILLCFTFAAFIYNICTSEVCG